MAFRGLAIGGPRAGESIVAQHPEVRVYTTGTQNTRRNYSNFGNVKEYKGEPPRLGVNTIRYHFFPYLIHGEDEVGYWLLINKTLNDTITMSEAVDLIHQAVNQNMTKPQQ